MARLRPLDLGELIDHAAALWKAHWRSLFLLSLPLQLASFIVLKAGSLVGQASIPLARAGGLALLRVDPASGLPQAAAYLGLMYGALVGTFFISQVAGVAATHFLMPRVIGTAGPSWTASLSFALTRLAPTTAGFLYSMSWSLVVMLGALFPGLALLGAAGARLGGRFAIVLGVGGAVALALGAVGLVLWFIIRFVLMAQVLGAESASGRVAFRRSGELSSGRVGPGLQGWVKGRLTVLLTIVGAILVSVSLVSSAPTLALGAAYGASLELGRGIDDMVPQAVLVPVQLLELVVSTIFSPLFEAFKVTFYVDMRVRREGLDLELELS